MSFTKNPFKLVINADRVRADRVQRAHRPNIPISEVYEEFAAYDIFMVSVYPDGSTDAHITLWKSFDHLISNFLGIGDHVKKVNRGKDYLTVIFKPSNMKVYYFTESYGRGIGVLV